MLWQPADAAWEFLLQKPERARVEDVVKAAGRCLDVQSQRE